MYGVIVAVLLVGDVPRLPVHEVTVDLIELNHYYDEHGEKVFDQLIGWDWTDDGFRVVDWRFPKTTTAIPTRLSNGRMYRAAWLHNGKVIRLTAGQFQETWTQHDPEVADRAKLPKHQRRGFYK